MKAKLIISLLFIITLTSFLLAPTIAVPWRLIDDGEDLRMSIETERHLSTGDFDWLFSYEKENGRFRPAYWVWNYAQFKTLGQNVTVHHITHIALYVFISILIFLISFKISHSQLAGIFAVILFLFFLPAVENFYRLAPIEPPITLLYLLIFYKLVKIYYDKIIKGISKICLADYLQIIVLLAFTYFLKETSAILLVATLPIIFIGLIDRKIKNKKRWIIFGFNFMMINIVFLLVTLSIKKYYGIGGGYAAAYTPEIDDTIRRFLAYAKMIFREYWLLIVFPMAIYIYSFLNLPDKFKHIRKFSVIKQTDFYWLFILVIWFFLFLGIQAPWIYVMGRYLTPVIVWLSMAMGILLAKSFFDGDKAGLALAKDKLAFNIPVLKVVILVLFIWTVLSNGMGIARFYKTTIAAERYNQRLVEHLARDIPYKGNVYLDFTNAIMEYEYELPLHFKFFYSREDINVKYLSLEKPTTFKKGDYVVAYAEEVRKYSWTDVQNTFTLTEDYGYPYGPNWRLLKFKEDVEFMGKEEGGGISL